MKQNGFLILLSSFSLIYFLSLLNIFPFIKFLILISLLILFWVNKNRISDFISVSRNVCYMVGFVFLLNILSIGVSFWSNFKIKEISYGISITTRGDIGEKLLLLLFEKYTVINTLSSFISIIIFLYLIALVVKLLNLRKSIK
ncbi:hypothetical protein [Paenibacillus sp. Y412MC10]|uniref:hypothetical protein n=1 Tax=Geobacillus sp. (strain Y412MC10) TaxID=481743 RepID=UPI00059F7B79|nr:hypothetical protein [Paenibacillus sp. Y412MC10]